MKSERDKYILKTFFEATEAFKRGELDWEGICNVGYHAWKELEDRTSKETLLFALSQLWAEELEKEWQMAEAIEKGKVKWEVEKVK